MTPPRESYLVRLPVGAASGFDSAFAALPKEDRTATTTVETKKGDTAERLAREHGIPTSALKGFNPSMRRLKSGRLAVGQRLVIPTSAVVAAALSVPDPGDREISEQHGELEGPHGPPRRDGAHHRAKVLDDFRAPHAGERTPQAGDLPRADAPTHGQILAVSEEKPVHDGWRGSSGEPCKSQGVGTHLRRCYVLVVLEGDEGLQGNEGEGVRQGDDVQGVQGVQGARRAGARKTTASKASRSSTGGA